MTNSHWMGSHMNTRLPQQFIKLPDNPQIHIYTPGWEEEMWRWSVINPHWMGSHTNTRLPQQFIKPPWPSTDTHILLGWKRKCEGEVYCPRTQHNDPTRSRTQTSQPRPQCTNHSPTTSPIAVWVRIVLKMIVVGRNDWCFNNQAVSYYGLWLSKCQSPPKNNRSLQSYFHLNLDCTVNSYIWVQTTTALYKKKWCIITC